MINPATGRIVGGSRYNGIVLAGDGFEGDGNDLAVAGDPQVQALFRGEPRGFSKTHYNVFEPRLGVSYSLNQKTILRTSAGVFHNRVTAERLDAARRQSAVPADGCGVGRQRRQPWRRRIRRRRICRSDAGAGRRVQASRRPTMWSAGVQREMPFGFIVDATYVGRRGLYLQRERNINQLQPGTSRRTRQ